MINQNIDILALRSFILANQLGSFSKAAEACSCSQAALSFRIKKLEESLGAKLFHRNYHHLQLTASGKNLLPEITALVKSHDQILNKARYIETQELVKLGVPEELTRPLFKDFMSNYLQLDQHINIELTMRLCRELIDMVEEDKLHMVITTVSPEHYGGEQLGSRKLLWVASPDFRFEPDKPVPLALHPQRCIYRDLILSVFEMSGIDYRIVFSAQGSMSVQAAVAAGMGLTIIAEGMVPPELVVAPEEWGLLSLGSIDIRLFKSRKLSSLQQEFAKMLKAAFNESMVLQ